MIKKLISLIIAVMMVAELIGDKVLAEKVLAEGVYYIESAQKVGHVIDVAGAGKQSGTETILYEKHGGENQLFVLRYDRVDDSYTITAKHSGKILGMNSVDCPVFERVRQQETRLDDAQKWRIVPAGGGSFYIRSKLENRSIEVRFDSPEQYTPIQVCENKSCAAQIFRFQQIHTLDTNFAAKVPKKSIPAKTVADGTYIIESALKSDMVVDVGDNGNEGPKVPQYVHLWSKHCGANQRFKLRYDPKDGAYTITAKHSGIPIGLPRGETGRVRIEQQREAMNSAQRWYILKNPDGTYTFELKSNGLVMDVFASGTEKATKIWSYEKNGSVAQKFYLRQESSETVDPKPLSVPGPAVEDGVYILSSALDSRKVVDVAGAGTKINTALILWDCHGYANQQFVLKYDPSDGAYAVFAKHVMNPIGLPLGGAGEVSLRSATFDSGQRWYIRKNSDGTCSLELQSNGRMLTAVCEKAENGTCLRTCESNGKNQQKFWLRNVDKEAQRIVNAQSLVKIPSEVAPSDVYMIESSLKRGMVLGVGSSGKDVGRGVVLWPNAGLDDQKFFAIYDPRDGAYMLFAKHSDLPIGVKNPGFAAERVAQQAVDGSGGQK